MDESPTMTTTPHPTDALPLPDLSYDDCVSVLGQPTVNDLQLFLNDYIRAAHREGFELAMSMQANEQWLVAKQAAIDVGGERPDLGYFVPSDLGPFPSFEECAAAITECGLPLGWVAIRLQQLIPGAFAPALASQPAQEQPAFKIYKGDVCYKSAEEDQSFGMWCPVSTAYQPTFPEGTEFYATAQPKQQQAGAAVSDADIIDATRHLEYLDFSDGHAYDVAVGRAILALKTAGGVA